MTLLLALVNKSYNMNDNVEDIQISFKLNPKINKVFLL